MARGRKASEPKANGNGNGNGSEDGGVGHNSSGGASLSSQDVLSYLSQASAIANDRGEANQQMSELVKAMVAKGGNRKALQWIRQLDKMADQDAVAVIEGLAFMISVHAALGKQTDLVRRLEDTVAP